MSRVQINVRGMASLAILGLVCAPVLQGCQTFGGGDSPPVERQSASRPNSDCARLAPLVTNPDGSLTRAELETGLKAEFKKWDKDGNGVLSQAEVGPLNEYLRSLNVGASPVMDWNGDGKVDFLEFAGGWRTMFDLCDTHNQGVVTKAAMNRSPNVTPPRPAPATPKPEGSSAPRSGGGGY
jgi:hypothetical protein